MQTCACVYLLDVDLGGIEVTLYFLCLLCCFFSFCPFLGIALLSLQAAHAHTHTQKNTDGQFKTLKLIEH